MVALVTEFTWKGLKAQSWCEYEHLLQDNSNLPGPRANLELAYSFAKYCENNSNVLNTGNSCDELVEELLKWCRLDGASAGVNHPRVFLVFAGLLTLGALYDSLDDLSGNDMRSTIFHQFREAMSDERWRVREAAAMGLQLVAEADFGHVRCMFDSMLNESIEPTPLEYRAMLATLAHPPILSHTSVDVASYGLDIARAALDLVIETNSNERRNAEFTVLIKGLSYALSVLVAHCCDEGFRLMRSYASLQDKEIRKILMANLRKARLYKKYPESVEEVVILMD